MRLVNMSSMRESHLNINAKACKNNRVLFEYLSKEFQRVDIVDTG